MISFYNLIFCCHQKMIDNLFRWYRINTHLWTLNKLNPNNKNLTEFTKKLHVPKYENGRTYSYAFRLNHMHFDWIIWNLLCAKSRLKHQHNQKNNCMQHCKKKMTEFKNKGRAVSMTRLDQLAQPTRRKGEHIRAVIERERQQHIETNLAAERVATTRKMSRSLTHLSSSSSTRSPAPLKLYQPNSSASSTFSRNANITNQVRPLRKSNATKSMTQLVTAKLLSTPKTPTVVQARIAQKHANDIEIDSRTTNVSAGVCSPFPFHFSTYLYMFYLLGFFCKQVNKFVSLAT